MKFFEKLLKFLLVRNEGFEEAVFAWIVERNFARIFGEHVSSSLLKEKLRNLQGQLDDAYKERRLFWLKSGEDGTEWEWAVSANHPISIERRRLNERIVSLHKEFDRAQALAFLCGRGFEVRRFWS